MTEPEQRSAIYQVIDRLDALLIAALKAEGKTYDQATREAHELMARYDWHQRQPIR